MDNHAEPYMDQNVSLLISEYDTLSYHKGLTA